MNIMNRHFFRRAFGRLFFSLLFLVSPSIHAYCVAESPKITLYAQFGIINLINQRLQPSGSILGATTIDMISSGVGEETVLWSCDKSDVDHLRFSFATNYHEGASGATAIDGHLDGVYTTYFPRVGLKIVYSGTTLKNARHSISLSDNEWDIDPGNPERVLIKAKHIRPFSAELIRVNNQTFSIGTSRCGLPKNIEANDTYSCMDPNAFLWLSGPGLLDVFPPSHGIAISMKGNTVKSTASCAVNVKNPSVNFGHISLSEIQSGKTLFGTFSVEVTCEQGAAIGVGSGHTAIGIQPSRQSYDTAISLNLLGDNNSTQYLLSIGYGTNPNIAKGVGINITDRASNQTMNLLGWPLTPGGGYNAGWYNIGGRLVSQSDGLTIYEQTFDALLKKIPGQDVTPGSVYATASVIVKVQ